MFPVGNQMFSAEEFIACAKLSLSAKVEPLYKTSFESDIDVSN